MGDVTFEFFAVSPALKVMSHKVAVVQGSLGHAAIGCIGVVADDEDVVLGLQINVDGNLAPPRDDEVIIVEERMVGDAGRPDDGVAADRFAVDGQLVGGFALDGTAEVQPDAEALKLAADRP